jgi:hypothetical protein
VSKPRKTGIYPILFVTVAGVYVELLCIAKCLITYFCNEFGPAVAQQSNMSYLVILFFAQDLKMMKKAQQQQVPRRQQKTRLSTLILNVTK